MKKNKWLLMMGTLIMGSMFMLGGCGPTEDESEDKTQVVATEETDDDVVLEDVVDETEEETEEEAPLLEKPLMTQVSYDFDNGFESMDTRYVSQDDTVVRGVYVSGYVAGINSWMKDLIDLADETELNAFVIDVKDDSGYITFDMDLPMVDEIGAERGQISDIKSLMDTLYEHNIYPIARIVTFKDPHLAKNRPELAIKNQDGSLWYYKGVPWLNPYNEDSWKYVVDVAKEAAKAGFKEIQFDYIRFEATASLNNASFDGLENGRTRQDVILEYVDYAMKELEPYGVKVSADVFGIVINSAGDAKAIGQDYVEMVKRLDAICPMVYPSHYGFGFFGIPKDKHSDLYPYETIYGSMEDSNEVLSVIGEGESQAVVRPWLQAFTASYLGSGNYMTYGKEAIRAQIQAAYDAGLSEWLLWHAGVRYNDSYLLKATDEEVVQ